MALRMSLGQSKCKLIVRSAQAQRNVVVHCLVVRTVGNKQYYMLNGQYKNCGEVTWSKTRISAPLHRYLQWIMVDQCFFYSPFNNDNNTESGTCRGEGYTDNTHRCSWSTAYFLNNAEYRQWWKGETRKQSTANLASRACGGRASGCSQSSGRNGLACMSLCRMVWWWPLRSGGVPAHRLQLRSGRTRCRSPSPRSPAPSLEQPDQCMWPCRRARRNWTNKERIKGN